jgi:hypothetical protein
MRRRHAATDFLLALVLIAWAIGMARSAPMQRLDGARLDGVNVIMTPGEPFGIVRLSVLFAWRARGRGVR